MKRKRQDKVDLEAGWTAGWHRKRFRELVRISEFHGVVTLARLANMLRFIYSVMIHVKGQGPEARRQRTNSFYLSGALLVEAEKTIEGVGPYFSKQPEYAQLVKAVNTADFAKVATRFRDFRNRAAFHINQEDVDQALERIAKRRQPFVAFLTAYGTVSKDLYYDLADDAAMEMILGEDDYGEWLKEWFQLNATVLNSVFNAVEAFIADKVSSWDPDLLPTSGDEPLDIEETRRIVAEREARAQKPEDQNIE